MDLSLRKESEQLLPRFSPPKVTSHEMEIANRCATCAIQNGVSMGMVHLARPGRNKSQPEPERIPDCGHYTNNSARQAPIPAPLRREKFRHGRPGLLQSFKRFSTLSTNLVNPSDFESIPSMRMTEGKELVR